MKKLRSVQKAIREIEKKVISTPGYKYSKRSLNQLKRDRDNLKKLTPSYLAKQEKKKEISNLNRSISLKNYHLNKKLISSTEQQKEKILKDISRNDKKHSNNNVKIFKLSDKYEKLSQSKKDLNYKRKQIIKNLKSNNPKYTKKDVSEKLAELNDIEEDINSISDIQSLPIVGLTADGIVLQDKPFENHHHENDLMQDIIPFWQVAETVKKQIDKESDKFETIEIRFPLGNTQSFKVDDSLSYEQYTTMLFNEINGFRNVKGRAKGTPEVNVEYNYTEKLVIINV